MSLPIFKFLLVILALSAFVYYLGRYRAYEVVRGKIRDLHSLPAYYGLNCALWVALPALLLVGLWSVFEEPVLTRMMVDQLPTELRQLSADRLDLVINDVKNTVSGSGLAGSADPAIKAAAKHYRGLQYSSRFILVIGMLAMIMTACLLTLMKIKPAQRARNTVETIIQGLLILCASIAILTTIGIVLSVLFESLRFFGMVSITDFLFGLDWSPQTAMRSDQVGGSGRFGAVPLFTGTLLISFIAMLVSVPIGLLSAIYLSEYASPRFRARVKPLLEILAGIPTVVYGFFAALVVAPAIRDLGNAIGLSVASESALAAGLVMGVMIIPFVSSLSDDVIHAVPQAMRDGAYGLGATHSETIRKVVLPAALPGIVGGIMLAISRAIGETMVVVMAAGLAANLTFNPLEAVTTVTVQMVTLLTGDQEFDSPKTLAAFALGLVLFTVTLILNVIALHIVRKYREQYE